MPTLKFFIGFPPKLNIPEGVKFRKWLDPFTERQQIPTFEEFELEIKIVKFHLDICRIYFLDKEPGSRPEASPRLIGIIPLVIWQEVFF